MTMKEFATAKSVARRKEKSSFFTFCNELGNYNLSRNGSEVCKWEAWHSGYKDHKAILSGNSAVKCELK